jgi:aspartyl/asparaginyl-tRNA synthetase
VQDRNAAAISTPNAEQQLAAHIVVENRDNDLVFVTDNPTERRVFYHMRHTTDPTATAAHHAAAWG